MSDRILITGATGFVGSHIAEAAARRGWPTAALVRAGRDPGPLPGWGVQIVEGDLTNPEAVRRAVSQADRIVHCAAKVGDWGPVEDYRSVNVEGLRTLLEACRNVPLKRFVHVSSLGVYAARHHRGTDETEPLPARHMDGYTQTKVEAEQLALEYHHTAGVPVVVLRPGFVYGPRDGTVMPKLVEALEKGKMKYIDHGRHTLNSTYVGNFVDAVLLALEKPEAVGQVFNITDGDCVSRKVFFETISDGLGLPRPTENRPLWAAKLVAAFSETMARWKKSTHAPKVTQARVKFLGLNLDYSIEKARRVLGYSPRVSFADGMRETLAWWKGQSAPGAA